MLWLYYVGWISTTPHYCQMIRDVNKEKRLTWCRRYSKRKDDFRNVIWSDECTVQIDTKRKCSRRIDQPKPLRPKPKHPAKVHIWGAISMRGASPIVIFTQNLNATRYAKILDQALLPFIHTNFKCRHRYQQDNDLKHTSRFIQDYFKRNKIKWWHTPPESPDLNPIEKVWGSLKTFLRNVRFRKPANRNVVGMKAGIKEFWKTLTLDVCKRYINHIHKVIPIVIENEGGASGH